MLIDADEIPIVILHRRKLLASATLLPGIARAQAWPNRPVRLILPYAAGGPSDIIARVAGVSVP